MILSNVKIKYMKEENHFEDVQNLFDDGYGLALGWKDYSITQLFIIEEENLMDINLFIGNKKYKCTKDPILLEQSTSDGTNIYILKNKVLNIYLPIAIGSLKFMLKVEGSKYINDICINGIYHLERERQYNDTRIIISDN